MSGIFNYDNPVWRFIGKFADIILLNILWLICSIPIFTIGASTTAVYYVTMKLARNDEDYTVKSFFRSFKENFKQATIIWIVFLIVGAVIGVDFYFFLRVQTTASAFRTVMLAVFGGFSIIYICMMIYVFPLLSRFYNPVKRTIFNAFFMSMRHFLMTIGILVIDGGVIALCLFAPMILILFGLMGFPLLAFINSFFFNSIFAKYMPKEETEQDGELRPLFADEEADASEETGTNKEQ